MLTAPRTLAAMLLLVAGSLVGCQSELPVEVLRSRGETYFEDGRFEEASLEYRQIVDRYPGDWQGQYRLGQCLMEMDDLPGASQALGIATTRRPNSPEVAEAAAEVMYRSGDYDRMFAFLQERARIERSPEAYMRLARYAVASQDPDSARAALEAAIIMNERRTVDPYLAAAEFYQHIGRFDEAVIKLRQAYSIDATDERVLEELRALDEIPGPTLALPTNE